MKYLITFIMIIVGFTVKAQVIPVEQPQPINTIPAKPKKKPIAKLLTQQQPLAVLTTTIKILSDADCSIFIDGEKRGDLPAGKVLRVPLARGSYLIKAIGTNPADIVDQDFTIKTIGLDTIYRVRMNDVINTRLQKEADLKQAQLAEIERQKEETARQQAETERKQKEHQAELERQKAERELTPTKIIKAYLDAIGGIDELNKINSIFRTYNAETTTKDQTTRYEGTSNVIFNPFKSQDILNENDGSVYNFLRDEQYSYSKVGNGKVTKTELTPKDLKIKHDSRFFIPELNYLSDSTKLSFKGKRTINGNEVYQIEISGQSVGLINEYFDLKTKLLLIKEVSSLISTYKFTVKTEFSDYRIIDNIKFAFKVNTITSSENYDTKYITTYSDIKINTLRPEDFKIE